jgi:mannitol-1-phosphate 5-dehydrogenase
VKRTFVGFGFGPIQAGLFVHEAIESGNFGRIVVAEVDDALVGHVRGNNNTFALNIAGRSEIRSVEHSGVEIYNPGVPADRRILVQAIAEAGEIATALPSVTFYASDENGVDALLCDGIRNSTCQKVIYAGENNNCAAEILHEKLAARLRADGPRLLEPVQCLNTVIGKMSQRLDSQEQIQALGLKPIVPGRPQAFLVESFSHILISTITLPGFHRGIGAFMEKDDLLPFEEAKLYGHNAIHALLGYLCALRGYEYVSDARGDAGLLALARAAFLKECGAALIAKYGGLDDLFTPRGYSAYADDLLERMTNPLLRDSIKRLCRDPQRKLGFDDRLIGTMALAIRLGVQPVLLARAAAAALLYDQPSLQEDGVDAALAAVWNGKPAGADEIIRLVRREFASIIEGCKCRGEERV